MRIFIALSVFVILHAAPFVASAQTPSARWVLQRIEANLAEEQMDGDKDVEAPSVGRGTSLVDQTDAPDLISLAMSVYKATDIGDEKAPMTLTLSGWALRNAVTQQNPLDPAVYSRGANWRRWSVTVGRELEEGADGAARVLGAKLLLWNGRDVSVAANRSRMDTLNKLLMSNAKELAAGLAEFEDYLFKTLRGRVTPALAGESETAQKLDFIKTYLVSDESVARTVELLTEGEMAVVDEILGRLSETRASLKPEIARIVKAIRGAPQLAFTYQARLRPDGGDDEHRWEGVFDYGPTDFLKLAVNGSFDLKKMPDDETESGGRLAFEFGWVVGKRASSEQRADEMLKRLRTEYKSPITLSLAGEAEWLENRTPWKLQTKLTLPIPALKGVALPFSVTLANDPELIDEKQVRGEVGFTLDFSQLKRALSSFGQ